MDDNPRLLDSRRLTGPNLLLPGPGAILDVAAVGAQVDTVEETWRVAARQLLHDVGWSGSELAVRRVKGGVSLAFSAPLDTLYAATEVNEAAWRRVEASLAGQHPPDLAAEAEALSVAIAEEAKPGLRSLAENAQRRGLNVCWDDERLTLGSGRHSRSWPLSSLPDARDVPWDTVGDIPITLVTGTNGKTTTVRMLAAMARHAGLTPGLSSTDGVTIGESIVDRGDYSGPGGARAVLRDRRVDLAVLETARGGILRRGLAVQRADLAAILNLAADHLHDFGVGTVDGLADIKLVVARAAKLLVLCADDPLLVTRARDLTLPLSWFSLRESGNRDMAAARPAPRHDLCTVEDGTLVWHPGNGTAEPIVGIDEMPAALGGVARHNVANALAAASLALHLGLPGRAVRQALRSFGLAAEDNPGRLTVMKLAGGVRALVDFAHNPHGLDTLLQLAATFPAQRRILILGQAGDRSDQEIRELARVATKWRPDHVVLKEMPSYFRGRQPGEILDLLEAELRSGGVDRIPLSRAASELEAVEDALRRARPGDLLVLPVHAERDRVLALLRQSGA